MVDLAPYGEMRQVMRNMACRDCLFWHALRYDRGGQCRCRPPRAHGPNPDTGDTITDAWWPTTDGGDFCGAFTPRTAERGVQQ